MSLPNGSGWRRIITDTQSRVLSEVSAAPRLNRRNYLGHGKILFGLLIKWVDLPNGPGWRIIITHTQSRTIASQ